MSIPSSEKKVQQDILCYLDHIEKGFTCKIELSGAPVRNSRGQVVAMRKFQNPYYRSGMSDIMFIQKGQIYFFEVKAPPIMAAIVNQWNKGVENWQKYIDRDCNKILRSQYQFLKDVIPHQARGGFVSDIVHVKDILSRQEDEVYFPF